MDMVMELERLKTIKRRARHAYRCSRALYLEKNNSSPEKTRVFYDAVKALDAMYSMYERLKSRMREKPLSEQIIFAAKWDTYIACIDAMTAYRTKDKYLLDGVKMDESIAKQTALKIWHDYTNQSAQRRHAFS